MESVPKACRKNKSHHVAIEITTYFGQTKVNKQNMNEDECCWQIVWNSHNLQFVSNINAIRDLWEENKIFGNV